MSFTIDGIVSGFDTTTIIESLLGFQQTQIDKYNTRKADITTEQSAFKGIEAQFLTIQNTIRKLNRSTNSVFDVQEAVSSNEDVLTAAAGSNAAAGTYNLTVNQLATAHQVGSQGFESTSASIATGEISFKVGDRAQQTITIDSNNATLLGMANTINEEVEDVTASIVYDQGADSHRLLLTSKHTGTANEISITNNLDAGTGTVPDFSGTAIQEATDAQVSLGSGAGAITASYSSNQIEGLIEDVTINLKSADPDKPVTIQVSADNTSAKEAISDFVSEFNSIMDFIDTQTQFIPETNQAGTLLGNRSVYQMRDQLTQLVTDSVPGLPNGANRLSAIGLDINTQGRLELDSNQLDKAFNGELEGIEPGDVKKLFGLNAASNNVGIEFIAGSNRTGAGAAIEVNITQAAEQATITATTALSGSTTITSSNNEFQITLDSIVSETLTLEEGTYTNEELATQIESAINNSSDLGSRSVSVSVANDGSLEITSQTYGSKSRVSSVSGSAASTLGFTGTEVDVGQNVAGEFIIDGVAETATGNGRVLVGDSDNENSADLQVRVSLTTDQIVDGNEGELSISRGVSGQLDQLLNDFLDSEDGLLKGIDDSYVTQIEDIDASILNVQEITESKRDFLIAEFTALESIISELRTTGDFLTQQLSSINPSSNN